jgi:hypothetical protein
LFSLLNDTVFLIVLELFLNLDSSYISCFIHCSQEVFPLSTEVTVCSYEENGDNFDTTVRLPLKTKEEMILWLEEFQAISKTTLRKSKTFPHAGGKLLFKVMAALFKLRSESCQCCAAHA